MFVVAAVVVVVVVVVCAARVFMPYLPVVHLVDLERCIRLAPLCGVQSHKPMTVTYVRQWVSCEACLDEWSKREAAKVADAATSAPPLR